MDSALAGGVEVVKIGSVDRDEDGGEDSRGAGGVKSSCVG